MLKWPTGNWKPNNSVAYRSVDQEPRTNFAAILFIDVAMHDARRIPALLQ